MPRLPRFGDHRYIGTRDDMRFYDCDDPDQFAALSGRAEAEDLLGLRLLQSFGPHAPSEARNRGFRAVG